MKCQFPIDSSISSTGDVTSRNLITEPVEILSLAHAQIFGSVEFNQSLRPSNWRLSSSNLPEEPYRDGEISKKCIHANFQYIHVHSQHGLRFRTENLECCSVLGTNLDACHFSNVRWPKVETHYALAFQESRPFFISSFIKLHPVFLLNCIQFAFLWLLHGAHKLLSWLVRFATRWMARHRLEDEGPNRSPTLKEYWRFFKEYCRSCWTLEQYGIRDHKAQNQMQDKELRSMENLENEVPRWRDQWALLSRAYRDLKTAYEGSKDYIYASDFHYAEKEFRRINYEVPRQIRIQLQLYWLVSGYGERVLRPIWWFLLIWILGAIPYACSDRVTLKPDSPSQQKEQASGRPSSTIS